MYLRIKIKCSCDCRYEIDRFPAFGTLGFGQSPVCPSCRQSLDSDVLKNLESILQAADQIPDEMADRISLSLKPRSQA